MTTSTRGGKRPGAGRKPGWRKPDRCPGGHMTAARAAARGHKCEAKSEGK
jgi:hypothetical protein